MAGHALPEIFLQRYPRFRIIVAKKTIPHLARVLGTGWDYPYRIFRGERDPSLTMASMIARELSLTIDEVAAYIHMNRLVRAGKQKAALQLDILRPQIKPIMLARMPDEKNTD